MYTLHNKFRRLFLPLIVIFTLAVRESPQNILCGPLPKKLGACALTLFLINPPPPQKKMKMVSELISIQDILQFGR